MKKTLFLTSLLVVAFSATPAYAGHAIANPEATISAAQLTSSFTNDYVSYTYDSQTGLGTITGTGINLNNVHFTVSDSALTATKTETNMIYVYTGTNSYGISVSDNGTIRGVWGQNKEVPTNWGEAGKTYSDYASYVSDGSISLTAMFNKDSGTKLTAVADDKEDLQLYSAGSLRGGAGTSLRINTQYVQTLNYYTNVNAFVYTDATGTHEITDFAKNVISSSNVGATVVQGVRLEVNTVEKATQLSQNGGDILISDQGAQLYVSKGEVSNHIYIGGTGYRQEGDATNNYSGDIRLEGGATLSGTITLLDNAQIASATNGGTISGTIEGGGKKLTIEKGYSAGTLTFSGNVTLAEMSSRNNVAFNSSTATIAIDKLNNSGSSTVFNGTTLTIKELAGTGAVTNNGIINLAVNEEYTAYVRTKNGYNGTIQKVITLGGTGALSGNGTWKVDNIKATLDGRTLTAVDFDETKYYVDKSNETYDSSLAGKYVISADKKLTISEYQENAKVQQNDGTIVLSGMSGYFAKDTALGNVELSGDDALDLTNGYTPDSGKATQIANLSGSGTITISGNHNPKERFEVTGDVSSSVSFDAKRGWVGSYTTFAFTKADVDNVSIGDVTNTTATLNFEAKALTVTSLTLNSGTVGVYGIGTQHAEENEVTLTTSSLTVNGDSRLNANLVVSGGTMSFVNSAILTMGSSVTIGKGDLVTVELTEEMVQTIKDTGRVDLFTSVETATLGQHIVFTGTNGAALEQADVYALKYDGFKIYVTPEPATATLSLLALAALAARRKRH